MRNIVISLLEYPERKEKAIKHFQEVGIDVEFYEGVHARKMGIFCNRPYMHDRPEGGELFYVGEHCNGIYLSHYSLWSALTLLPDEHFHIMEIDAKFEPNWKERFDNALVNVPPDFDILYTGSCCVHRARPVQGEVHSCKQMMCMHSYIVAKKALQKLLETNRDCYEPIDISIMKNSFPHLNTYVVLPRIVEQFDTGIPV